MYDGNFIAGINTSDEIVTYHIKSEYWDLFIVKGLENAHKYYGYDRDKVLKRILSLNNK